MVQTDIESLLDRTRAALRAGNLAEIPKLTAETEAALDRLPDDPAALAALATAAARNAACLTAALAGVRAARARLVEIGNLRRSIGYDGNGRRRDLAVASDPLRRL